jgi:5-methylcytosine-specific restriction endonuclease McrA
MRKPRPSVSVSTQIEVLFRDAWLCHLCRRPVILHVALKRLQHFVQKADPDARVAYWQTNWRRDAAPLLDELAASVDHVEAFSRGGAHDTSNFRAVCARCNARKSARDTKRYLDAARPWKVKGKHGEPTAWDGLSSVFVLMASQAPESLSPGERTWLKELRQYAQRSGGRLTTSR